MNHVYPDLKFGNSTDGNDGKSARILSSKYDFKGSPWTNLTVITFPIDTK